MKTPSHLFEALVASIGSLVAPVAVFSCIPLAISRLDVGEVARLLILLSLGRIVAGFDFGIAQLATPKFIRTEQLGRDRRVAFCFRNMAHLLGLVFLNSVLLTSIFRLISSDLFGVYFLRDVTQIFVLAVGFSLTTFSREMAMVTGTIGASILLICPLALGFFLLIYFVGFGNTAHLIFFLSTYLTTQALLVVLIAIRSHKCIPCDTLDMGKVASDWRIAAEMQLISVGNLAAVQVPTSIAAVFLSPEDIVFVGVAFQVANAVRLVGTSVAPFLLARMARMRILELTETILRMRKLWWAILLVGSTAGIANRGLISSRVFRGEGQNVELATSVAWGFLWAAIALTSLLTTTALRSKLQLRLELGLAGMSTLGAAILGIAVWLTKSPAVLLGGALASAIVTSLVAESKVVRQLKMGP